MTAGGIPPCDSTLFSCLQFIHGLTFRDQALRLKKVTQAHLYRV